MKKNWRLLKTSFIKEIQYIGKTDALDLELEPPPVNIARIRQKEQSAVRNLRDEVARIGVGVTQEAQEIFNSLSRTYVISFLKLNIKKLLLLVYHAVGIKIQ